MTLEFVPVEEVSRICALVIADYGMGKTCLARTALGQQWQDGQWVQVEEPEGKVLILAAEPGLLSVRDLMQAGHIDAIKITTWEQMREAYMWLNSDQKARETYTWVMIDSLTEIADQCEKAAKQKHPDSSDSFKMWGDYSETITDRVKEFRDLPHYNVIFTCLPSVDKDENNRRFIGPDIVGKKIKQRLPSYFDEVFYLREFSGEDGKTYRAIQTVKWEQYPGKDRSGKLAPMEEPNLLKIARKILG